MIVQYRTHLNYSQTQKCLGAYIAMRGAVVQSRAHNYRFIQFLPPHTYKNAHTIAEQNVHEWFLFFSQFFNDTMVQPRAHNYRFVQFLSQHWYNNAHTILSHRMISSDFCFFFRNDLMEQQHNHAHTIMSLFNFCHYTETMTHTLLPPRMFSNDFLVLLSQCFIGTIYWTIFPWSRNDVGPISTIIIGLLQRYLRSILHNRLTQLKFLRRILCGRLCSRTTVESTLAQTA